MKRWAAFQTRSATHADGRHDERTPHRTTSAAYDGDGRARRRGAFLPGQAVVPGFGAGLRAAVEYHQPGIFGSKGVPVAGDLPKAFFDGGLATIGGVDQLDFDHAPSAPPFFPILRNGGARIS